MTNESSDNPHQAPFLLYAGPDGVLRPDVFYAEDTVWLSNKRIAEIFAVSESEIGDHIQNIYTMGELDADVTQRLMRAPHDQRREHTIPLYSLDVVIALSYRVSSSQALRFRRWATQTLRTYMVQGFAIDDERLDQGRYSGENYTDRLLSRAQDIRTSERGFYQKITSLYATAGNYSKDPEATREFYRTAQNKLHYAVHGYTAPEIVVRRADAHKPHMGLTTWAGAPQGDIIRKSDIHVAKNYLMAEELQRLNRIAASYLDYAEIQRAHNRVHTMDDWETKLNAFLSFYEYPILDRPSRITPEAARSIAEQEYEAYKSHRRPALPSGGEDRSN